MDLSLLRPYHGYQTSIIPLSNNYYFYLASWDRTPTRFIHFTNIWLITPENKRILFSDPPASSEIVCIYHEFNEICGASIKLDLNSENKFHVQCNSESEAYKLNAEFQLAEPLTSKLLVTIGSSPPTRFRTSNFMIAVSNFLVNTLVARKGSAMLGKTETGQSFYHGETERLFRVVGGSVSLNGEDLGAITSPTWPIEFGDAVPFFNPVIKFGTLYIPFEQDMLGKGAKQW